MKSLNRYGADVIGWALVAFAFIYAACVMRERFSEPAPCTEHGGAVWKISCEHPEQRISAHDGMLFCLCHRERDDERLP